MSGSSGDTITPITPTTPVAPIPDIGPIAPITGVTPVDVPPPAKAPPIKNAKAVPYFLPEDKSTDLMKNRGAAVEANAIISIIDGESIFKEFETEIQKATSSVLIAFWAIDPEMKMVTNTAKTWGNLLIDTAKKNVMVRILWTDFDPGLQLLQHAFAWKRYLTLGSASQGIPNTMFQIVCSHHEAEIPHTIMAAVRPNLYDNIATELNAKNVKERIAFFQFSPGLWDKIDLDIANKTFAPKTPKASFPACPAVHHQKTIIIDGKFAYTGGLNITSQYVDASTHLKKADPATNVGPWHDAFVKVEGSFAVKQFIDNYIGLWNQERKRADSFLQNAFAKINVTANPAKTIRPTTDLTNAMITSSLTSTAAPSLPCQVRRTVSVKGTAMTGVPQPVRKDILEGYLLAIQQAESYIYIENQYFREKEIGDAIISQHKKKTDLRTIILLPKVAEEFLKSAGDDLSKHGAALQFEILELMKKEIKDKLGLFSMVRKDKVQIYVHSKLLLIDDKFGSIGSANINPRSFRVDTELDFVWYDEKLVKKLRDELWKEILGKPSDMAGWKPTDYVKKWSSLAKKNSMARPAAQKGFVFSFENNTKGVKSSFPLDPFT